MPPLAAPCNCCCCALSSTGFDANQSWVCSSECTARTCSSEGPERHNKGEGPNHLPCPGSEVSCLLPGPSICDARAAQATLSWPPGMITLSTGQAAHRMLSAWRQAGCKRCGYVIQQALRFICLQHTLTMPAEHQRESDRCTPAILCGGEGRQACRAWRPGDDLWPRR